MTEEIKQEKWGMEGKFPCPRTIADEQVGGKVMLRPNFGLGDEENFPLCSARLTSETWKVLKSPTLRRSWLLSCPS